MAKKKLKELAKQNNLKPEEYLIKNTPETRDVAPTDIDMTTNSISDREHAQKVINRFELLTNHGRVGTDIFYGMPKLHPNVRTKLATRLNAAAEEKINLSNLNDLAKQHISATSPPPSYKEVITSDKISLPTYAQAIRMRRGN